MKIRKQNLQLTIGIPMYIIRRLELKAGDEMDCVVVGNKIVLEKVNKND